MVGSLCAHCFNDRSVPYLHMLSLYLDACNVHWEWRLCTALQISSSGVDSKATRSLHIVFQGNQILLNWDICNTRLAQGLENGQFASRHI